MQLPSKAGIADSKIGALNGLRGIAIAMVVLFHLFIPYTAKNPLRPGEIDGKGLFAAFMNDANLGVNIFFILSGFVFYLPHRTGRRAVVGVAGFPAFYWKALFLVTDADWSPPLSGYHLYYPNRRCASEASSPSRERKIFKIADELLFLYPTARSMVGTSPFNGRLTTDQGKKFLA